VHHRHHHDDDHEDRNAILDVRNPTSNSDWTCLELPCSMAIPWCDCDLDEKVVVVTPRRAEEEERFVGVSRKAVVVVVVEDVAYRCYCQ